MTIRTSSRTVKPAPGELKLSKAFWPVLAPYARNLLVGTDVGERLDDEGGLVVAGISLFRAAVDREVDDLERDKGAETKVRRFLAACAGKLRAPPPAGEPFRRNVRVIGKVAGLRRVERRVLEFLLAVRMVDALEKVTDCFPLLTLEHAARLVAIAIAEPPDEVRRALRRRGRLVSSGLVTVQPYPDFLERKLMLSSVLPDLVMAKRLRRGDVLAAFAPAAPNRVAFWSEIAPRIPGAELFREVVTAGLRHGCRGVNVLLHGPPGVGKSVLARALACELNVDLRDIRTPLAGGHPAAEARLATLVACDLLVRDRRSVFLFDAIEDVLEPHGIPGPGHLGPRTSRAWLDRRLERNAVPTIWTCSDASRLDPALLGRFSFVLEVPVPDERGRRELLARAASPDEDLAESAALARLAVDYAATPAELDRAIDTARLAHGGRADAATVAAILDGSLRARGATATAQSARPEAYRPECINATADVESIARTLSGWTRERGGIALLLHGLPGTGKTEWVHELGRRLGRSVLARRASDVESKWVGESEQNLARAFREAADRGALLLFDEVDSFLRDRREAAWRHDVQLTNEFLQQLEAHPGIVACTTNLLDALDPAVLRRFPLKIEFRPLAPAQAATLFAAYFGALVGPAELARVQPTLPTVLGTLLALTAGDFAAVAHRVLITGEVRSADDALRLLREEVALRPASSARPVGFAPQPAERREPSRLLEAATLER